MVLGHSANAMADAIDDIAARFVASEVRRTGGDEYEDARSVKRSGAKGEGLISFVVLYDERTTPTLKGTDLVEGPGLELEP